MPRLPVVNPTAILSPVIKTAARTEFPAAERFSARISSDEERAGLPDMMALSPLAACCAKYGGADAACTERSRRVRPGSGKDSRVESRDAAGRNLWRSL